MSFDSILFLRELKQCPSDSQAKNTIYEWSEMAALLTLQRHGCAMSQQLIVEIKKRFGEVMQAIRVLNNEKNNSPASKWLFSQICEFYQWINLLCGLSAQSISDNWQSWQQEQKPIGDDCKTKPNSILTQAILTSENTSNETYDDTHKQYSKYD